MHDPLEPQPSQISQARQTLTELPTFAELTKLLEHDSTRMDFFQALRLLENARPDLPRIGESWHPRDDAVRFSQEPELLFHSTMLGRFHQASDTRAARLTVNFFGLTGSNGPLPLHLTEYAHERLRHHSDPTLARFLDIFHHRLLQLFYRARASAEPAVSLDRPQDDRFGAYVGTLFGGGTPAMQGRCGPTGPSDRSGLSGISDFARLHFAGLLAAPSRPASGLVSILSAYFQVPVTLAQFCGHWMRLPVECRSRLGVRGFSAEGAQGSTLGVGTVLGGRVWDCQSKFRLVFGPLGLQDYCRLLPGGDSMRRLQDWVRSYVGDALEWDVQLVLRRSEVPRLKLGGAAAESGRFSPARARLGRSTWLISRPPARDAGDLIFNPTARKG